MVLIWRRGWRRWYCYAKAVVPVSDRREHISISQWLAERVHRSLSASLATTLDSVRNTQVFRTALTALTEPRTLWWGITRYPSPRRWVALHSYLLYFLVTYRHHQNDTCVSLFAVAAVTLKPFTQCLAMCMRFSGRHIFGNAAGAPGHHSYYLSFNAFQNLCIQFVFSSIYLCIYIATYLHTVYLDWQHAPPLPLYLRTPAVAD